MRVCIVPEYPMSLMTGGLQVQAKETYQALKAIGQDAELFEWSKERPAADYYHFVGFPRYLARIISLVREAGKPYAITILFGGNPTRSAVWVAKIRQNIKSRLLRKRERYEAVKGASAIITITKGDAEAARSIFGIDKSRIHVVQHGIGDCFFGPSPSAWQAQFGTKPFVLCVGAIQPRKNQLLLVQACNEAKLPVLLLGPVLPGESSYAEKVAAAMQENALLGGRWLTGLKNEDPLLLSAYAACRLYVLLSREETQPLSVLQAMAGQKPVLLLKADYASDPLFSFLPAVASESLPEIVTALKAAWQKPTPTQLSPEYSWESVAQKLVAIYSQSLEKA